MKNAERLAESILLNQEKLLLFVTGAGVSVASGIPTFRGTDPEAVWKKDVTELGTVRYFNQDPAGSWSWYTKRFDVVFEVEPNPAHAALVRLERWQAARGEFLLITQNVDTLHEQAGSEALVKVHGSADRVRCSQPGCVRGAPSGSMLRSEIDMGPFLADPVEVNVPRCPECGSFLRQHVLWFDETYQGHDDYQWERVVHAASTADLVLFAGTSLSVGVTDMIVRAAVSRGAQVVSIDPGRGPDPDYPVEHIRAKAEVVLPQVCSILES